MRRSIPKREKRKPKTKPTEDRRPHVGLYIPHKGWVSWEELHPKTEKEETKGYYFPARKAEIPTTWSQQDAHILIDMYASACWGNASALHHNMAAHASYFIRLYERQEGKCAITGMPIYGGPGLLHRGIGIDLLSAKRGIRKGNVRLVSLPLAVTRFKHQAEPNYGRPLKPKDYDLYPITWVVFKQLQQTLIKHNPFRHIPVSFYWFPPNAPPSNSRPHSIEMRLTHVDIVKRKMFTSSDKSLPDYERSPAVEAMCGRIIVDTERFILSEVMRSSCGAEWMSENLYLPFTEPVDFIEYFIEYFAKKLVETYSRVMHDED